jgi:hypothetical protein
MNPEAALPAPALPPPTFRNRPVWAVVLLGLVVWQGWMTLSLFGRDQPWQRLIDGQPILSGRHPLHLYHGLLGASSFLSRGELSCYDPAFQTGYPKTPVFDSGCRPAEMFLTLVGGQYKPAAYKIGLALSCCFVPLLLAAAARGIGLGPAGACLASALGLLVWWGEPSRNMLEAGELDILMTVLLAVVYIGLLLRFHREAGFLTWLALLVIGCMGWFAQPLLFTFLLVPLLLVYYYTAGVRHRLMWHVALLGCLAGGVAVNALWLIDLVEYWWLRVPWPAGERLLTHRTLQSFWDSPVWGGCADRGLAMILLGSGLIGVLLYNLRRERATARLLGLGVVGLLAVALLGTAWEPLGRFGAARLLVPALWFAVLPAVHAGRCLFAQLTIWTGVPWRGALVGVSLLVAAGWASRAELTVFADRCTGTNPFILGLSAEQQAVIDTLQACTTTDARILWEDQRQPIQASRWTALLPVWTGRSFLGGLDPEANLEHGYASLIDQQLAGRPIVEWPDAELSTFCDRYNVGWVACRSAAAIARFNAWCASGAAVRQAALTMDGQSACLFALKRQPSFVLKGQARWIAANHRHIILGDVVPEKGSDAVVLSLHFQSGMEVAPPHVQIEKDPDPFDPIPMIRLRLAAPVTRVILTWPAN